MSKLSDFMKANKIGTRQLLSTSHALEMRTNADRAIARARRVAKTPEAPEKMKELAKQKPKSGRPLSERALGTAMAGESVKGPQKTRIARAVNAILARKKKPEVTFRDLFG